MTDGTALMQRSLTDNQIRQRIELNKQAGWGLEKGSAPQLNLVFLICQKFDLLPGDDVTLYDGKPWITIDGRVKLARRHPEYRGHSTRPLTKDEKEAWGYDPDDLVVEATIRTATCGEIQARGKVSKAERFGQQAQGQRLNFVARVHPVEMAEKRALARAERFAFGTDAAVPEEESEAIARAYVEERNEPGRVALGAARHAEIFDDNYADDVADIGSSDVVKSSRDARWKAWTKAAQQAADQDISVPELTLPIAAEQLVASTATLTDLMAAESAPAS